MDNTNSKQTIETVDKNGKKLKLYLRPLGHKILQEAQMVYNIHLTSLIKRSVAKNCQLLSRQQLEQHLSDLCIWTENDARKFLQLQLELRALELKLKQGGIKVAEAKKIALEMKMKRAVLLVLYNRRSQFDGITMESIADNQKFKFLLTQCVMISDSNTPFFLNIKDYDEKQNEQASVDAASVLAGKLYGYDENTEANLVENQWLQQFKFADGQGRLVNEDNQLIDLDGNLIDEDGRFIDKHGDFVDNQGRRVDENGDFVIETKPFLDDDTGKPLTTPMKKGKKRSKRKKCKA